jgi:hypothetical protein
MGNSPHFFANAEPLSSCPTAQYMNATGVVKQLTKLPGLWRKSARKVVKLFHPTRKRSAGNWLSRPIELEQVSLQPQGRTPEQLKLGTEYVRSRIDRAALLLPILEKAMLHASRKARRNQRRRKCQQRLEFAERALLELSRWPDVPPFRQPDLG